MGADDRLSMRFTLLVAGVFIAAVCAYLVWGLHTQQVTTQEKVLAEARTLGLQMMSAWDYINDSQGAINYNSDGAYDFKHIYCSIAGKDIAQRFTGRARGYVIRFARQNPRSSTDVPDAFESEAIASFSQEKTSEYFRMDEYGGKAVFRYALALEIKNNCLSCHGEPAGSFDETGFIKEGMHLGDLAGIASIIIPLEMYEREATNRTIQSIAFFVVLAGMVIIVVRFALKRWVTGPLNALNLRLHDENKAQQDFLAIMSHELRTPLSSIMAFTDVWEKDGDQHSDRERRLVGEIKENSRVLLNMVNNTIDVAKLESGQFSLSYDEVDLVDVIQSVTAVIGPLAAKNAISVTKSIDPHTPIIISDSEALRKVFMNIIGNAVKFSYSEGAVAINVSPIMPEEQGAWTSHGAVRVTVSDNGPGIPLDKQEHVFERFAQATDSNGVRVTNGSGLGLFLAKALTERLGGTIGVRSAPGQGSTFLVELPLVAPDHASSLKRDAEHPQEGFR